MIVFFASEMNLVAKSAELFKSATKKRDLKNISPSVVVCDQNHANRISPLKVVVSEVVQTNVKVTIKRLYDYVLITSLEHSFGSNL